jgi:hypothetical protein
MAFDSNRMPRRRGDPGIGRSLIGRSLIGRSLIGRSLIAADGQTLRNGGDTNLTART